MTVYRLSGDKIRIALSDSEVLSFSGLMKNSPP